ncbi:uncharacterized protein LOC135845539 [Planococcus citri]|uniref:uncharacterized protein LOC135845539 n=1 Tax=Planococcus citri TaxID=170843 RepID=UPI0031F8FBB3
MSFNQPPAENRFDESLEKPYVYFYELPSLQKIASYEICRAIWYSNLSEYQSIEGEDTNVILCHYMIGFHLFRHYKGHIKQLIKHLNIPPSIEDILKNSMSKICDEIQNWAKDFANRIVHLEGHDEIRYIDPKWSVWSIGGEIDHLKSAKRILRSGSLTEWQKFLVMCEYCMVDEITKFPLDSLPPAFITEENYSDKLVCFYWICLLKNELHRVPLLYDNSVDITLAKSYHHLRYSREFFWNRLSDDHKINLISAWISQASSCIIDTKEFDVLEIFISKMSPYQQQRLLHKMYPTIVSVFASWSDSSRCALWAWSYGKNKMHVEQFATLVDELLRNQMTVDQFDTMVGEWSYRRRINSWSVSILDEIWKTASDHQRNHVIQNKLDEFMRNLLFDNGSKYSGQFLQFVSEDERKKLIFRSVNRNDFQHCDVDFLSSFLNEYLPRPGDQLTFRKLVIDSSAFLERLMFLLKIKNYEMFDETLKFYFSHDAAAAKIFKREFLEHKLKTMDFHFDIRLITSISRWNKLSQFIDEVFDEDPESGLMVKQWFITSTFAYQIRISSYTFVSDLSHSFDKLVKIVEMVFKNDELKNVKRFFSDEFRSLFSSSFRGYVKLDDDDDVFLLKFVRWCSIHDGKPILQPT